VIFWEAASGAHLHRLEGHEDWVMACALSPDGTRLVSASGDGTLILWEAASGARPFTA
jgi:WD40 repeat protein